MARVVCAVSGVLVIGLQPYTQQIECGDGPLVNFLEDWLEDLWALVSRGASATSMMLWYETASQFWRTGTDGASTFAQLNLLVCFTLVSVFIGSKLSVSLEQMEERLRQQQQRSPRGWRGAAIRFSDVLQNTLGFVAGCLACDVVTFIFTSLSAGPSIGVMASNVALTAVWTLAACAYLLRQGEQHMSTDRDAVEAYFLVNSASFFVGWMWLVVMRDAVTMCGVVLQWLASPFRASAFGTQLIAVLVAAPALSLGTWRLREKLFERALDGTRGPAARAAEEKEAMRAERDEMKRAQAEHARARGTFAAAVPPTRGVLTRAPSAPGAASGPNVLFQDRRMRRGRGGAAGLV